MLFRSMHGGEIVKWDNKKNISEKIEFTINGNKDYVFWGCVYLNNVVYLIPNAYNKVLFIEIYCNTEYLVREYINMGDTDKGIYYSNYIFCASDKNHILLFDKDTYLSEIDKEKKVIRREQLKLNPKNNKDYNAFISRLQKQIFLGKEQTIFESNIFPLGDYIQNIINNN